MKTRAIAEARIKTEQLDSETLAHLLRGNLIAEAYAPDFQTRDKKNLLRYRASLVKIRSMIKNMVHAVLARNHIEEPGFRKLTDKFGKKGKAYIRAFQLRGNDTEIVHWYLDVIEEVGEKINVAEQQIQKLYQPFCVSFKALLLCWSDTDNLFKWRQDIPGEDHKTRQPLVTVGIN